jgi:hypothetical protein
VSFIHSGQYLLNIISLCLIFIPSPLSCTVAGSVPEELSLCQVLPAYLKVCGGRWSMAMFGQVF